MLTKDEFENRARPIAEDVLDYIKANGKPHGITDAKVMISTGTEEENSVELGSVVESVTGTSWAVAVTLYAGDRRLPFATNSLDKTYIFSAIDDCMNAIHLVPENPDQALLDADKVYKGPEMDFELEDQNPPTTEELVDYAVTMEKSALSQDKVKTARSTGISKNKGHSLILATNGLDLLESKTSYQAVTQAIAEDDSGMEIAHDFSMARHFADMADPKEVGKTAGLEAASQLNAQLPDSKKASIILAPEAAASLFGSVMSALDGTALHRGTTFMKDKLGKQVTSSGITIEDDPHIKRAMRSTTTDSAGMKTEKKTFVENGILKMFNVSLQESRQLGIDPIGRNDGPTNLKVLPGSVSKDDLMADIKDGLYIKGFNGGRADINNGDFSRQAYGLVIKDGKITDQAVAGFVVSGNLKQMFMNLSIANDTPELPHPRHSASIPTTRVDGIKIAGR